MANRLNVYLNFKNNARQAMEFYKTVFGGELTMNTFADYGMEVPPAEAHLIMHSQLEAPNNYWLMGADTPSHMEFRGPGGFGLSLSGEEKDVLTGYWDKLVDGGTITQPLTEAPWGDSFGMLIDKFGTPWMVNITARKQ